MDLELVALQRQSAALARRLELLEAIIARAGIVDVVVGSGGRPQGPDVDPSPIDLGRLIGGGSWSGRVGGWLADPAPDDLGRSAVAERLIEVLRAGGRVPSGPPAPVDPAPVDISRLSKVQLEASLHTLAAERARLESIESLVKEQISQLGEG